MELCLPRHWPSPCLHGLLLILFAVLVPLLAGIAVRLLYMCCRSRRSPAVGHAAEDDEEAATEDKKFTTSAFATTQREHPKSIPATMKRSPDASPEPVVWARRLRSPQAAASSPTMSTSSSGGQQSSPAAADPPCLPWDFAPASQRSLKEFSHGSLVETTRSFDRRKELGRGDSGVHYAGDIVLDDGLNKQVAIKMFHKDLSIHSKQIREDLRRKKYCLQHRNLVTFFGYCLHEGQLYLVYDLMHCYSLAYELFADKRAAAGTKPPVLNLSQRLSIIKDVAQGLYQLHKCQAFHGAVKASNIMLEPCSSGFRGRLGDFRYSNLLAAQESSDGDLKTTLWSLMMYQCPTDAPDRQTPSLQTDMLHFGGVMLEVMCGRRMSDSDHLPAGYNSLVEWVRALHRGGRIHVAVDEDLKNADDYDHVQAVVLLYLALRCRHPDPSQRPTAGKLLLKLAMVAAEGIMDPIMVRHIRRNVPNCPNNDSRLHSASM